MLEGSLFIKLFKIRVNSCPTFLVFPLYSLSLVPRWYSTLLWKHQKSLYLRKWTIFSFRSIIWHFYSAFSEDQQPKIRCYLLTSAFSVQPRKIGKFQNSTCSNTLFSIFPKRGSYNFWTPIHLNFIFSYYIFRIIVTGTIAYKRMHSIWSKLPILTSSTILTFFLWFIN